MRFFLPCSRGQGLCPTGGRYGKHGWAMPAVHYIARPAGMAAGHIHGQGHGRRTVLAAKNVGPMRARAVPRHGHQLCRTDGLEALPRLRAGLQHSEHCGSHAVAHDSGQPAPESAGYSGYELGSGPEHGGELCHQYQLASLFWRKRHGLSGPDGRPYSAELCFRRCGYCGAVRLDPGAARAKNRNIRRARDFHHASRFRSRQLLGRRHPRHPVYPCAALPGAFAAAHLAGRAAEFFPLQNCCPA